MGALVRRFVLLAAALLVVLDWFGRSSEPIARGDGFCGSCLTFEVGPPEVVFQPTGLAKDKELPDSPFLARRFTTTPFQQMTAYTADGQSFRLVGSTLKSLNQAAINPTPVLGPPPSPPPSPLPADSCGAWLQTAEQDGSVIRGWYHSETLCHYENYLQTHKSVSYAQSTDGGVSWTKTNYPDNVVIQGSNDPCGDRCNGPVYITGSGDPSVIRIGDFYYMYFEDTDQQWPPNGPPTVAEGVARAPVASGGLPGSWQKWCDGAWSSQPDCHATALILGSAGWSVSRSTTLQQLIAVLPNPWVTPPGMQLLSSSSTDGMAWSPIPSPLIHFHDLDWIDRVNGGELYGYPSLVPESGGSDWGQTAYLYYMYLYPHENFEKRYLVRRRVDVTVHGSPVTTPQAVVPLQRWYSASHNDHWVTTAPICFSSLYNPPDWRNPCDPNATKYDVDQTNLLGGAKVYSSGGSNLLALQDCYYKAWDDHMISLDPQCEGMKNLRTLGWIWAQAPQGINTVPLYRCFDSAHTDHFLSTDSNCEGVGPAEFTIGYAPLAAGS
jgi:hypothetical protein